MNRRHKGTPSSNMRTRSKSVAAIDNRTASEEVTPAKMNQAITAAAPEKPRVKNPKFKK